MTTTRKQIVVNGTNGVDYHHDDTPHLIFMKKPHYENGQLIRVDYTGIAPDKEIVEFLKEAKSGETQSMYWYHGLVRHGHPGRCGYYPLPLLFSTMEQRLAVAAHRDVAPPKETWVAYKRQQVIDYYQLDKKTIAELILGTIEQWPGFQWIKTLQSSKALH